MSLTNYGQPKEPARGLRRTQTDAEKKLWSKLRNRQINGLKFRRQSPLGPFFADFCCVQKKIIVEVDGSQHMDRTNQDAYRTTWLINQGFRVIRFWNNEVLENIEGVCERILIETGKPHPNPLPHGRGRI